MKALSSMIVLGIGLLIVSGSPVRAQYGGMGDTLKKGATDAAKQEIMKGAAQETGLAAPEAPAAVPAATDTGAAAVEPEVAPGAADAPAADTGAASAPAVEPEVAPGAVDAPAAAAGSDTGAASAPVGEPKVAPAAADAPADIPGAAGAMEDAGGQMRKMMPKVP